MGAVEHFKTLCCLGLTPESAMVAVTPLLHQIIPHGYSRFWLFDHDASFTSCYAENPEALPVGLERFFVFLDDPASLASLLIPAFHAVGIGWTLHRQGRGYLESGYYREVEHPIDSCWLLDAMIADTGLPFAGAALTRPRSARPFTADDVLRLDQLRPWLAHAFRRTSPFDEVPEDQELAAVGAPVLSGQAILTSGAKVVFQTPSLEQLLTILTGEPVIFTRYVPARDRLPAPILKLLRRITGAANRAFDSPPRMQMSTVYGTLTLEAKWLVPAHTLPEDVARDPKSCLISVTIELREHAVAHAARMLRERGATPAQTKVGIQLALGKTKPVIADELGIKLSSVADLSRKLYRTLGVHNSAELGARIWLGQDETRQNLRRPG
jgi:DNA-binding CsgD family transcriptional regulator